MTVDKSNIIVTNFVYFSLVEVPHLLEIVTVVLPEVVLVVGVALLTGRVSPSPRPELVLRSHRLAQGLNHRTMKPRCLRYSVSPD